MAPLTHGKTGMHTECSLSHSVTRGIGECDTRTSSRPSIITITPFLLNKNKNKNKHSPINRKPKTTQSRVQFTPMCHCDCESRSRVSLFERRQHYYSVFLRDCSGRVAIA